MKTRAKFALLAAGIAGCAALVTMPDSDPLRELAGIGRDDEKWLRVVVEWAPPNREVTITQGVTEHASVTHDHPRSPVEWRVSLDPKTPVFVQAYQFDPGFLRCRVLYGDDLVDESTRARNEPGSVRCGNPPRTPR